MDGFYDDKIDIAIVGKTGKYSDFISDTGFCGDRSLSSGTGINSTETAYASKRRIADSSGNYLSTQSIQFTCNEKDRYTTSVSRQDTTTKGNGVLTYPVGLITSDEALAGGVFGIGSSQTSHWLYTGQDYWTMSPIDFDINNPLERWRYANLEYVTLEGQRRSIWADSENGVRPVLSLKSDVELTGSGLSTDPFKVVGTND